MADEHLTLDRIEGAKQSVCCHADVREDDGRGFVCDECGRACDLEQTAG